MYEKVGLSMDCIKIQQLEVFGHHGCKDDEKINGLNFYIDMNLYGDIESAGIEDDLDGAINYAGICRFVQKFVAENSYNLLETIAEKTTQAVLKEFPRAREMDFAITKLVTPDNVTFKNVTVSIHRGWKKAYLNIGTNGRDELINQVIDSLYDDGSLRILTVSNYVQTPFKTLEGIMNLLHGCLEIETLYSPKQLQNCLRNIENERAINSCNDGQTEINIVFYDNEIIQDGEIVIPLLDMHKKEYILEPLNQIAPYAIHPILRKTVSQMITELKTESKCDGCSGCSGEKCEGCSGCGNK